MASTSGADMRIAELEDRLVAMREVNAVLKASRDRLRNWVLADPNYHNALIDGDLHSSDLADADPAPDAGQEVG